MQMRICFFMHMFVSFIFNESFLFQFLHFKRFLLPKMVEMPFKNSCLQWNKIPIIIGQFIWKPPFNFTFAYHGYFCSSICIWYETITIMLQQNCTIRRKVPSDFLLGFTLISIMTLATLKMRKSPENSHACNML